MDTFLNEEQAGCCIVNFYRGITARMQQEKCFCGERVGVLVQENVILESEKDSKEQLDIFYNVGEIIQIGVNQATYLAAEERIRAEDNFQEDAISDIEESTRPTIRQRDDIERFLRGHIKNRAMRIYPNNPVFVDRMDNHFHEDLLADAKPKEDEVCDCCQLNFFCLYHVMLRTLRYTNEIVVDISNNCLQSLFWLGAAHGLDVYAITVMYEKTEKEKKTKHSKVKKESRYVFDVAGLWMAILRKNDTERFYEQLVQAQNGIERNSKLMLPDSSYYKREMQEYLFASDREVGLSSKEEPQFIRQKKRGEDQTILELYYQDHFWIPMLAYNKLSIYISRRDEVGGDDKEPKLCTGSWDFDAISLLTHYLSKRKVIGEYSLSSQPHEKGEEKSNFISIGSFAKPELPQDIFMRIKDEGEYNTIYTRVELSSENQCCGDREKHFCFKGFQNYNVKEQMMLTHHPRTQSCATCNAIDLERGDSKECRVIYSNEELNKYNCELKRESYHYEIAQLILWREDPENLHGHSYFWVGIIGCSGPATCALSTLFIDQRQREIWFKSKDNNCNLLLELQTNIRKKFMEVFLVKLQQELDKIELKSSNKVEISEQQKSRYFGLVKYAVASYLNTVLYKYFFPFLSERDMDCIYNGVYTFVNSMKASKVSPFVLKYPDTGDADFKSAISETNVKEIAKMIPEVLLSVLKSFKGFEAFYVVSVNHRLDSGADCTKDTRSISNIKMMYDNNLPKIDYFFVSQGN